MFALEDHEEPDGRLEEAVERRRELDVCHTEWLCHLALLDEARPFTAEGYASTTAFLVHSCGMSSGDAKRSIELAHQLVAMPLVRSRALEGRISVAKLAVLARGRQRHPDEFVEFEETFAEQAERLTVVELRRLVEYWSQALDEASALVEDRELRSRRHLHLSRMLNGMVRLDGELDAESGEIVMTALASIVDLEIKRSSLTDTPGDRRTPAQRRADALVEICRQALDRGESDNGGEKPHLSVLVSLEGLLGDPAGLAELSSGEILHPDAVARIACDCSVRRIVLSPEGEPIDVGRKTRTIPPAIRAGVVARDRHCGFPGCDRPPAWCDCHHILSWTLDNGPTALWNLLLLCRHHHRLVHEGGFRIRHDGSGGLLFTRPDGRILEHRTKKDRAVRIRPSPV